MASSGTTRSWIARTELLAVALAAFAGCASQPPSFPESRAAGLPDNANILYGDDYLFSLATPTNWDVDTEAGKAHGIDAVFFPAGTPWQDSVSMYPQIWQKGNDLDLAQVIAQDLEQYLQSHPGLQAVDAAPIALGEAGPATVRHFSSSNPDSHEAVAYIDRERTVVVLVLHADDRAAFEQFLPTFESWVQSYKSLDRLVR
jgi:hypothetical protein